jgi:hypothetical protein
MRTRPIAPPRLATLCSHLAPTDRIAPLAILPATPVFMPSRPCAGHSWPRAWGPGDAGLWRNPAPAQLLSPASRAKTWYKLAPARLPCGAHWRILEYARTIVPRQPG